MQKIPKNGHGDVLRVGKCLRIIIYNFGGSNFFTFSQKCLFTELEPIPVWNFDARLLFRENFFQIFAFYKRWSWDIFPSVEHRHGHFWEFFAFSALSSIQL